MAPWVKRCARRTFVTDGLVHCFVKSRLNKFLQSSALQTSTKTSEACAESSGKNTGVIALIDLLIEDLDTEMIEIEIEEKDPQADYDGMMTKAAEERTLDSKSLTQKSATKASVEEDLDMQKDEKSHKSKELAATLEYINSLHMECDWL